LWILWVGLENIRSIIFKNAKDYVGIVKREKIVNLGGVEFLVISLSESLRQDVKGYPGDPQLEKEIFSDIEETGYNHYVWRVSDHIFRPHGDAPKHQNKDRRGFECWDLDYFFNSALMIDLSDFGEEIDGITYLTQVETKHLLPYENLLSKKGAVIIRTGYDRWLESNRDHDQVPYLTSEAGEYISTFCNLKVFGTDSLTVDRSGSHYVHQWFKDLLIVESLVNLYGIPKNYRESFDLQTSTVSINGATGGPVSAFAFIKEEKNE
jgi:kynurenine formamidase